MTVEMMETIQTMKIYKIFAIADILSPIGKSK